MGEVMSGVNKKETILVTGGAGYIGSHTIIALIEDGYSVIAIDNFSNGSRESLRRVEKLTGATITVYEVDTRDKTALEEVFMKHPEISVVMHLAGKKAVGESVEQPLIYYDNNVAGSLNLMATMTRFGVDKFIFSSTATVYGDPVYLPFDEVHPVGNCTSPYAKTKFVVEQMLLDHCKTLENWSGVVLRYFNPVGAHKSGEIGEDPQGIPNNLTPYLSQVAIGKLDELKIFGDDYDTDDGTGVRDYIHITDLARGHLAAVSKVKESNGFQVFNLGTGKGSSVYEVLRAFEKACGKKIKHKVVGRREGDIAAMAACPKKAENELGWKAEFNLDDMCQDLWNWQTKNPDGFRNPEQEEDENGAE